MKSIIRNILLEEVEKKSIYLKINDSKLGNVIRRDLTDHYNQDDYIDPVGIMKELSKNYAVDYDIIKFISFKWLIDTDEEPTNNIRLDDWLYEVSDKMTFLKDSGYYQEYVIEDIDVFTDITKTEDNRMLFKVHSWSDFAYLFDDAYIAERVMDEDWADLFDAWDTSLEEIFNSLNDRGVRIIQDFIIENVEQIVEIGHREEFWDMMGDVGGDYEGVIDVASNVENIRQLTDLYNLLLLVDEGEFPQKDEMISGIRSAYNNAYNGVAEDEIFEHLKSEIEEYLGSEGETRWEGESLVFDITDRLFPLVNKYIEASYENPLENHRDFIDMLNDLMVKYRFSHDRLSTPDIGYFYPDHREVEKWFNEALGDYIY